MPAAARLVRSAALAAALAGTLTLVSCAGSGGAAPTWVPQPSFAEPGAPGGQPGSSGQPGQPAAPGSPGSPGASGTPSGASGDPSVVATKLTAPTGLALLPDDTALVGERTTGRIVQVQPTPDQPVRVIRTLSGLDTSGDGGLLDLAVSPTYGEDGLVYAYETTPTDNRIVEFTLSGAVTPVLTGIPRGASGNTARMVFGADGDLYVATGDAGNPDQPATSLAGKVLRVNSIGQPAPGNPTPGSPVWAVGLGATSGLCLLSSGALVQIQAADTGKGEVNLLAAGRSYAPGSGQAPLATLPSSDTSPGGCAELSSALFVASRDGRELVTAAVKGSPALPSLGPYSSLLTGRYGRLLTVVPDPEGALWITTSNRDGHGRPVADDERVLRIVPSGTGTGSQV